ncbi:hypothetical protein BG005_011955 [Podila minutissima]|nr:hypothetical protein BG005_011955 [Podila minutissima]
MAASATPLLDAKRSNEQWNLIAYTRLGFAMTARVAKYTGLYLTGKTPKTQPYMFGVKGAMLFPVIETVSLRQARAFQKTVLSVVDFTHGLGSPAKKAKWATPVSGQGWKGFWIPFQDQHTKIDNKSKDASNNVEIADIPIGTGCDMVVLAIHGGGYIDGDALMSLNYFKHWMKSAQMEQQIKIGIVAVEYSLSPEVAYPVAMNEIIAAYTDLIQNHNVSSKRIVLFGDSAGGNITLGTSLKLRDAFQELGAPAGHILVCPWVRSSDPLENSMFDFVSTTGCEIYTEAYIQNQAENMRSPYTSPISAPTLAGLAPMLIFIGGVEILRPSIEKFVAKACAEEVEVTTVLKEGRSHNYMLLDDISTSEDRFEAWQAMSKFMVEAHNRFQKISA